MKPHMLIAPWKGDKRFTDIAKRAATLKKSGYRAEEILATITAEFGAPTELAKLHERPQPSRIYGIVGYDIDPSALEQLQLALRLPIAVKGALMPDAHPGYALPIGGVFAAHNAVAPAMVGVDIGCRMHLSIFDIPPDELLRQREKLFDDLKAVTIFGSGKIQPRKVDHAILDDARWNVSSQTRSLRAKAAEQLGTSGSGNHFAELVIGERVGDNGLPEQFVALLTHSGSRGVGHMLATYYIKVAAQETAKVAHVPKMYEWLDLDSEAGQEYWQAMQLAGAYAQANHEIIHAAFARRTKLKPMMLVQNHHNFAWQEGDLVIHRKGATPARLGEWGVIPGSMGTSSYIVEGLGSAESLWSASHGAGRVGSRTQAKSTINMQEVKRLLKQRNILVHGLSVDESPQAYKDIERVISLQVEEGLIRIVGRMHPVAVIMAGEHGDS